MKLAEISIRNPVMTWMLMLALILFGAIAFQRMGVSQLPDVDFPFVNVRVNLDGASPEVVESTLIDPIEEALISVEGVRSMTSTARTGSAQISLEFGLDKNIDVAIQEVQTRLGQAQRSLPREVDPPIISKNNPEDQPILWLSVRSDTMPKEQFMTFVRDQIKDRFATVPGVSEITLGGYLEPSLRVWVSGRKLNEYALTVQDLTAAISTEHLELPSGRIEATEKEWNIRLLGEAMSAEAFGNIALHRRGGSINFAPLALKDVAQVEDGLEDVRRVSRTQGVPSVGLGIRKQRGTNAVAVGNAIKTRLEEVRKELPPGVQMDVNFDLTQFVEESVNELVFHLILAAFLTCLVCWLFLGSWTATLNVILSIPTSIIGTFIVLNALGFTLNIFTLLGLTLAIGIVVDDSIMVLENIVRHREMGKGKRGAALEGAIEITFAALAATAAIVAIFLPVAFMEGVIGRYFFQFGVTISVAVLLSLLEALTLTPMRSAAFLNVGPRTSRIGRGVERFLQALERGYARTLTVSLQHPIKVIALALIFFVGTLWLGKGLKKEMVPAQDQSRFMIRVSTPEGSSLQYTDKKLKEIESLLSARKDVARYFSTVGAMGSGEVSSGMVFITLTPPSTRQPQAQVMNELRDALKEVKGARAFITDPSQSGFGSRRSFPVEFSIQGPDWRQLGEWSENLKERLEKDGIMVDADSDFRAGMPEIQVTPDRQKARIHGVSIEAINETISLLIGGGTVAKFTQGGRRYDVRLRLAPEERTRSEQIKVLKVRNNRGELISLASVVSVQEVKTLLAINRQDRSRTVSIYGNVGPQYSQGEALIKVQELGKTLLPSGYRVVMSGSSQVFKESFDSLIFALILGLIVAYMVLASQFNSFMDPVTVLLALPFSASGALIFLWLGDASINIYSMIGLLLLMGIVKKNSILLVDFANHQLNQESRDGALKSLDPRAAMLLAGPVRLRPILMTSLATIAAALPQALAYGPGAEARAPMALAVVGGVLVSTFLTLYVIPCFYPYTKKLLHKGNEL